MTTDALSVLHDIRAATLENAAALPHKEEAQSQWQGLGFLVSGVRLVAKMGEIDELFKIPRLTPLPAVKHWVKGIANIRGRLVPIIDLHEFLQMPTTLPMHQWRILLVEDRDVVAGLLVEQSLGMLHFARDSFEPSGGGGLDGLQPYITGTFHHGGRVFHEINLKSILRDERFFDVAAQVEQLD